MRMPQMLKEVQSSLLRIATPAADGILVIGGARYSFRRIRCDQNSGVKRAIRVVSPKAESHDVAIHDEGYASCSCGDFLFRGDRNGCLCKHASALIKEGLLALS